MANLCKTCKRPVAWNDQRFHYKRAIMNGHPADAVKQLMPRCGKCLKNALKQQKQQTPPPSAEA